MDKYGVIWTRATGEPEKIADMVLTSSQLRITKTNSSIDKGVPGISLLHDISKINQLVYLRTESNHLPPQLAALLPPGDPKNPQRRILSSLLERSINVRGMPIIERDWHMLMFAGHNGIGHLDVFQNDDAATLFYQRAPLSAKKSISGSSIWFAFNRFISDTASEEDEQVVYDVAGVTPGVSGFMPKMIVPIAIKDGKWQGDLFGDNAESMIVKVGQDSFPGLLALEELSYKYHRMSGFKTPKTYFKTIDHHGESIDLMAIERFDRHAGLPIPLESFYSILKTGSPSKIFNNIDGSMEMASKVFDTLRLPARMKLDWYRRFVMSFLTGNGDLHLENMSLLGGADSPELSPVYDPAPMRAYRGKTNHDLLSALPFCDVGGVTQARYLPFSSSGDTPDNLRALLILFGKNIGIDQRVARSNIEELFECTRHFKDEAISILESIPKNARKTRAPDIDGFAKTLEEIHLALSA
jgi:serine/threonine-protein kinase HipA